MPFPAWTRFAVGALLVTAVATSPVESSGKTFDLVARGGLTVHIGSTSDFCMVVPKDKHTNIGDSEYPGGETVWCSATAKSKTGTGTFAKSGFWKKGQVALSRPKSGVVQLTGCINVKSSDRLNPRDDGGQYDSSGGDGGQGNPAGSRCSGYNHYVELIEPSANRACLRCCQNSNDCPTYMDTAGCPQVIPGKYFSCD